MFSKKTLNPSSRFGKKISAANSFQKVVGQKVTRTTAQPPAFRTPQGVPPPTQK